ncbi:Acg family FMN-binding oxidoreductase [Streptomyces inhibens]|uniref:Acg family FMN-binding oxidoreductase n=1 Tax=Streptomyces inhibens TaxID=2293571 RepID=UPI0037A30E9F
MSPRTLDDATVTGIVTDATTAPSMHNAQPWRFRYHRASRTFALRADLERALPHGDPATRGLHLGCGAALLNLRVAAGQAGHRTATTLLPVPADPALLATVRLDARHAMPDEALTDLYPAIHERHTSRYPFADRQIPESVRTDLSEAARREGAQFAWVTSPHLQTVLALISDAEGYDHMDPDRAAEERSWIRDTSAEAPVDGIPDYALGPRKRAGTAPARDFAGLRPVPGRPFSDFERHPQLALLSTAGDAPTDWLRAGQALERVLLLATLHGVTASFATQALEWPELRWILRDPVSGTGHVQMVVRLGYGPSGPRTPRRPVGQVLTIGP